ncbi:MAG TPA: ABC transporter permease [Spirochaetia bacterium]|nr:ABC transporter permease [Spirochaetia bacterium]
MSMMWDADKWQEILSGLAKHKLRTALTAFGVFWGIFMLVLLIGIGNGLQTGVMRQFEGLAVNTLYVWSDRTSIPYKGLKAGRWFPLTNEDTEALRESFPEIENLSPQLNLLGDYTVDRRDKSGSFRVSGVGPEFLKIRATRIASGRAFNPLDMERNRKVAVIGSRVREVLFGAEDPLGQYIKIKGVYFQVVGLLGDRPVGGSREEAETIAIPFSTMQHAFNMANWVHFYVMNVRTSGPLADVEGRIKRFLAARHSVSPEDPRAMGSWNNEQEFNSLKGLFRGVTVFLWIVGIGTIVAGIVGVSNIMLIIVKERTREIGIRMAVGATPGSIIGMIIQESVLITSVSGYLGMVAGVGVLEIVSRLMDALKLQNQYFANPSVDIRIAITATVLLVVAGTAAGFFPALRAAGIKPVEALKEE